MKYSKTVALAILLSLGAAHAQAGLVFRVFAKGVRVDASATPAPGQPASPPAPVEPEPEPTPPPAPPPPKDPYREQVVLLTQFNGAEGARAFDEASGVAGAGAATGTARLSAQSALFGGTSLLLDGASSVTYQYSTFVDAVKDFTAEFWVRSNVKGTGAWANPMCGGLCFSKFDGGWGSGYGNGAIYTNDLYFEPSGGGNYQKLIIARNGQWNDGQWHHVAVTRSQGVLRGFIDGMQPMPSMNAAWAYKSAPVTLGRAINGGLDDARITYGVARYTAPFTPPSTDLTY